jgi:hypothetical protein
MFSLSICVGNFAKSRCDTAASKKLVEQGKVLIIVGSLSGSEGIAIRDFSRRCRT